MSPEYAQAQGFLGRVLSRWRRPDRRAGAAGDRTDGQEVWNEAQARALRGALEGQENRLVRWVAQGLAKAPSRAEVVATLRDFARGIGERFATRAEIRAEVERSVRLATVGRYVTEAEARVIATEAVPRTLRGLDSTNQARTGNTLLLAPGGASGTDAAYWGQLKLPAGGAADSDWMFGVKAIAGTSVTMRGGVVLRGMRSAVAVGEESFTITASGQVVYVSYSLAAGTAAFGLANELPLSASGTYVKALQSFALTGTGDDQKAEKLLTYHRGVVQVDGVYG